MEVLLVNLFTGTIEQRCSVISFRACEVDSYDLDPDAAYSLYGTMDNSLDPIHYIFNMSFIGQSVPSAPLSPFEKVSHPQISLSPFASAMHCFPCGVCGSLMLRSRQKSTVHQTDASTVNTASTSGRADSSKPISKVLCCTACTEGQAAIATGAEAQSPPTFQPSSLRSPSPSRGQAPKPAPTKAATVSSIIHYPVSARSPPLWQCLWCSTCPVDEEDSLPLCIPSHPVCLLVS